MTLFTGDYLLRISDFSHSQRDENYNKNLRQKKEIPILLHQKLYNNSNIIQLQMVRCTVPSGKLLPQGIGFSHKIRMYSS